MKTSLVILLLFFPSFIFPQSYTITSSIQNLPVNKIILTRIQGDNLYPIDSLIASNNELQFNLTENLPIGLYRLILGKTNRAEFMGGPPQSIDLIFNRENILIKSDFNSLFDSLEIIESEENKIYYEFLRQYNFLDYRKYQVYPLLNNYPRNIEFFKVAVEEFSMIQEEQTSLIEETCRQYPESYAARLIKMYRTPFLEGTWTEMERVIFMRDHFFDGLDFADKLLLNSNIYTEKIIEYLSLYRNPNLMQSEQEDLFIEAVDHILTKTNQDPEVYAFILDYLIRGFEKFKFEKVLNHIADHYLNESCETENKSLMQKRLEAYRKMALGNTAPDIVMEDLTGNIIALSEIGHEYILVLFWASWCPHCNSMLPELKKWYDEERDVDIEIYAVSIDTSITEWHNKVISEQLPWINCNEPGGWYGKVAMDYNLYATPTMFILDRNRKILAKPVSLYEFRKELEKL